MHSSILDQWLRLCEVRDLVAVGRLSQSTLDVHERAWRDVCRYEGIDPTWGPIRSAQRRTTAADQSD